MGFRTIEELCAELEAKRTSAKEGGGTEAVSRQKARGKNTARERITGLLDAGSFVEIDEFVTHRCDNFGLDGRKIMGDGVITGYGTIDGRKVYVYSQDFTVFGGSLGEKHAGKICKIIDMAMTNGCPVIGINDSGGARIQEGTDALNGYGEIFRRNTMASGLIPQFSLIMGPTAGGAVYSPALTDYIFMVDGEAIMHITGPEVIRAVTGEAVTSEELGGAVTHNTITGDAHFCAKDENECFAQVRKVLSYLPLNNLDDAPLKPTNDDPQRAEIKLRDIVPVNPNKGYDVHEVIKLVADDGEFVEVQAGFAKNIVTGYAHIGSRPVGIVANNADELAGCLDINASDKASRFVRHCDAFNIPIVTLVDVPGYLPGKEQEYGGIIRKGAKLLYAYSEASVPLITVIMRKAYGGAYIAMASKSLGADVVFAWPQAEIAVMGAEGAASIVFKKDIENASDPSAKRLEKIEEYRAEFANPYKAAERGYVDRVIMPEETRKAVCQALDAVESKREERPAKKHGVIPH